MINEYKKLGYRSALICIVSLFLMMLVLNPSEGNIWETGNWLAQSVFVVFTATYFFSFWYIAKAKGYSGFFGLFLIIFSILGIIILIFLRDKTIKPATKI